MTTQWLEKETVEQDIVSNKVNKGPLKWWWGWGGATGGGEKDLGIS